MTDLFKSKENEFYIELKEERYYIPGEDISGDVVLDLTKPTKTNNIKLTLEGIVEMAGRPITLFSKNMIIAESLDGQKSYYLEAHTHRFPFRFKLPDSKTEKVPSTLEISKVLKVYYKLTATYIKAYAVLEKLCPTTFININVLEDINVESAELIGGQSVGKNINFNGKQVSLNTVVGKRAIVRGDILPISVQIENSGAISKNQGICVTLFRSVYYGKNKSEIFGPKPIRETSLDIIIPDATQTKTFDVKFMIPNQICPTVGKSGRSFKIEYSISVKIKLNSHEKNSATFEMPIIIGTYPRLSFNIDDDDDDFEDEKPLEETNSSEYDEVAEKMNTMDLESDISTAKPESLPNSPEVKKKETHSSTIIYQRPHTIEPSSFEKNNNPLITSSADKSQSNIGKPIEVSPTLEDGSHSPIPSTIKKSSPTYATAPYLQSQRPKYTLPPLKTEVNGSNQYGLSPSTPALPISHEDIQRHNSIPHQNSSLTQHTMNFNQVNPTHNYTGISRYEPFNYNNSGPVRQETFYSSSTVRPDPFQYDNMRLGRNDSVHQFNVGINRNESINYNNVGINRQESLRLNSPGVNRHNSVHFNYPGATRQETLNYGEVGVNRHQSLNYVNTGLNRQDSVMQNTIGYHTSPPIKPQQPLPHSGLGRQESFRWVVGPTAPPVNQKAGFSMPTPELNPSPIYNNSTTHYNPNVQPPFSPHTTLSNYPPHPSGFPEPEFQHSSTYMNMPSVNDYRPTQPYLSYPQH